MKKKLFKILAVSCMAVMMFAGCGTNNNSSSNKESQKL